ncbi:hypothetical protein [Flavobacterium sp. A45]|nr:hypothetical protein [Flavobacterium sp. A45]
MQQNNHYYPLDQQSIYKGFVLFKKFNHGSKLTKIDFFTVQCAPIHLKGA